MQRRGEQSPPRENRAGVTGNGHPEDAPGRDGQQAAPSREPGGHREAAGPSGDRIDTPCRGQGNPVNPGIIASVAVRLALRSAEPHTARRDRQDSPRPGAGLSLLVMKGEGRAGRQADQTRQSDPEGRRSSSADNTRQAEHRGRSATSGRLERERDHLAPRPGQRIRTDEKGLFCPALAARRVTRRKYLSRGREPNERAP